MAQLSAVHAAAKVLVLGLGIQSQSARTTFNLFVTEEIKQNWKCWEETLLNWDYLPSSDNHHHQVVVLGPLVRQVRGHPPQQLHGEVAGWECVQNSSLFCLSVVETDDPSCLLLLENIA